MFRRAVPAGLIVAVVCGLAGTSRAIEDGFYVSLGIGGAIVTGDRGIMPKVGPPCVQGRDLWREDEGNGLFQCILIDGDERLDEISRTDFGSGLGFQLRLGYNILGYVSPEVVLAGNGDPSNMDGSATALFQVRYHPAQHAIEHADRAWDVDVYVGVGYVIAGYHPDEGIQRADDGKGWEGFNLAFGAGFNYAVADIVSLGIDLKFMLPQFGSWIVNFDEGWRQEPFEGTPSTFIFMPMAQITFHP